ncbi:MAG: hypothetical protein IPM60_17655 [Rhodospirillales bacterium]|nr:hypothetical protein [Rhodospirillales bacterium]
MIPNHITDAAAHNLLGRFGAVASDAMVQDGPGRWHPHSGDHARCGAGG